MSSEQELLQLKKKVEELRDKASRSEGALESSMQELRKQWKCGTLKQAKKKLAELKKEEEAAAQEFDAAMQEFERKWSHKLDPF